MQNIKGRRFLGLNLATAAIVTACAMGISPGTSHAQTVLTPLAIVPPQDVYSILSQYSALSSLPLYSSSQVTGQYTHLTVIGDSWADWGNGLAHNHSSLVSATGRYGNEINIIDGVQYHYGLSTSSVTNYAWGGATSGSVNNNNQSLDLPGWTQELEAVVASGQRFGWSDLIDITTTAVGGSNDLGIANYGLSAITTAQGVANLQNAVQTFVNLGAHNFVLTGTAQLSAIEAGLASFANSGVRIFLFDEATLASNVAANPGLYGFTHAGEYCTNYGGSGGACATPNSGTTPTNAQLLAEDQWTSIYQHPTSAFAALIAQYETNQVDAPATIAAQSQLGQMNASAFSSSLFYRLDSNREFNSGLAQSAGSSTLPLSLFADGNYQSGKRADRLFSFGYDYNIGGGTVGGEYRFNPNTVAGVAVNSSLPHATLNQNMGHLDMTSYQIAVFGSVTYPNWFIDGVASFGYNDYKIVRPGVVFGNETASPRGTNDSVGVKGGYLFDVAPVKVGPIGGINYTESYVGGYTEQGDYLLNQMVSNQHADMLTGEAGAQIRLATPITAAKLDPYINLTAEHEFLGGDQSIITTQVSTPMLPVTTPVTGRGNVTYGQVALGVSATPIDNLSVQLHGSTTFAQTGGNNYGITGGVKYSF